MGDSRGGHVARRSNDRIQVFDKDLNYLDCWKHFAQSSGITILKDDTFLVADSESGVAPGGQALCFADAAECFGTSVEARRAQSWGAEIFAWPTAPPITRGKLINAAE